MKNLYTVLLSLLVALPCISQELKYFPADNPNAPFSDAVLVGNTLYLAGRMGRVPGQSGLVSGGVAAETHQVMKNIKVALEKYGSSMEEVVKCTVFMANPDDRSVINKIYTSYFPKNLPARSGVGGLVLAGNGAVEIECIATVGLK